LESSAPLEALSFKALQVRLLGFVNARIRNGELSERALARYLGVSQPHLHNVLKGARHLQMPLADKFLAFFRISVGDLLTSEELQNLNSGGASGRYTPAELTRFRLFRKQPASAGKLSSKREAS
jgi:transcriptional regulator with XRE-family HTH domain